MFVTRPRRWLALSAAVLSAAVLLPEGAHAAPDPARYVVVMPVCRPAPAGHARCLAERLVPAKPSTPGARRVSTASARPSDAAGPAGGFTPSALANAYRVDADTPTNQTVAIVDAFDNPNALADLNTFDARYGLPAETTASFAKYSQSGSVVDLPTPNAAWAGEETLDIQAVRGICHKCRIVVVEANSDSDEDLAAAENYAVELGAKIITNSFGEAEGPGLTSTVAAAFNHPGVVITAGSGDDGWYSWDHSNAGRASADAPFFPASLDSVVAVGGTSLQLADDGSRASESVWNTNYEDDLLGSLLQAPLGATGGGCSTRITAPSWQTAATGWDQTGCITKRLSADVAAVADPTTGFDVYNTFHSAGWQTVGGTSLSSPLIAAMWALAGGGGGVAYPARTLYEHLAVDPERSLYDVTVGGNGYCGGDTAASCEAYIGQSPNTLGYGQLDCAFLPDSEKTTANTRSCDAAPGFDGPSGVGTPTGLRAFTPLGPSAVITAPPTVTAGRVAKFSAAGSTSASPSGSLTDYQWTWGDGTQSDGPSPTHTYASIGNYRVTLTVTDDHDRSSSIERAVPVSTTSTTVGALSASRVLRTRTSRYTVTVRSPGATPAGRVYIYDGKRLILTSSLIPASRGTVTVTLPRLPVGGHPIQARYNGQPLVAGSVSNLTKLTVTTTSAAAAVLRPRKVKHTKRAALKVIVRAPGATPTGKLAIYEGKRLLSTRSLTAARRGVLTIKLPALRTGVHHVRARYSGSPYIAGSSTKVVSLTVTR